MPLSLKTPHPARGAQWVRDAFRLFAKRPMAFAGLFFVFLFVALLIGLVPVVGPLLQMAMLPMLSLGFMVASASALQGGPVHPGQFVEPLGGGDAPRRGRLLALCLAYGVGAIGVLLLANVVSGGQLGELQRLVGTGEASQPEIDAMAADRGVFVGTVFALLAATLLSVPFWHAPALVYWGGQGVAQSLFSSTLAVWRAKGAFLVYALAWFGMAAASGLITALLLGLLGAPQLVGLMALVFGLMFSTAFYVSLVFSFHDCFGQAGTPAPDAG
ncbi:MAG: hypothetical protein H6932_12080 [Burkholderiaceae bacterium]|nr:hypothetical protein [Burkholderiaceae bacterium]